MTRRGCPTAGSSRRSTLRRETGGKSGGPVARGNLIENVRREQSQVDHLLDAAGEVLPRQQRDANLRPRIRKAWDDNRQVYGIRKSWRQLRRWAVDVARCTVSRLMAGMNLQGDVLENVVKTTISDTSAPYSRATG